MLHLTTLLTAFEFFLLYPAATHLHGQTVLGMSLLYLYMKLNQQKENQADPVSDGVNMEEVTANAAQHIFKVRCCCFENAPNTDLLFFEQSM